MAQHNAASALLRQRLLHDVAELQSKPYPGVELHIHDGNALETACLVLSPEGETPLHLTIHFGRDYSLSAPEITVQSEVDHPNVFGDYICASILNTTEGYTPAYTLKGICIQLLSFFSSDRVEQDWGGVVDRTRNRRDTRGELLTHGASRPPIDRYACAKCGFNLEISARERELLNAERRDVASRPGVAVARAVSATTRVKSMAADHEVMASNRGTPDPAATGQQLHLVDLPNEMLILVTGHLDDEALFVAARPWNGFGRLLRTHNLLQTREMQCFTLKRGFKSCNLGVGVLCAQAEHIVGVRLCSQEAFGRLGVRRSVQGLSFERWLALPLSEAHWRPVKGSIDDSLHAIGQAASLRGPPVNVLYSFMNDVVVKLAHTASEAEHGSSNQPVRAKSTLTHASEKAVESYFQLYHLLITLATDRPDIAADANTRVARFLGGERDKTACPNLDHLLVVLLISDMVSSVDLTKAIIKEAVTPNVVWMLDGRGAGTAELSYMEASDVSDYLLQKTYEASRTSYNLLMFANLMRRTVVGNTTGPDATAAKTLRELREELFNRHGAPPVGAAAELAAAICRIQKVDSFPSFLHAMDVPIPPKTESTRFLRRAVYESVDKGYFKWVLSQEEALAIRVQQESTVEVPEGMRPAWKSRHQYTFFPQEQRGGGVSRDRGRW